MCMGSFDGMENRPGSIVVLLLLLVLIASSSACDYGPRNCGTASVPYPFGMQEGCGLPNYRISCKENASFGAGKFPFLQLPSNDSGEIHEFQVLSFSTSSLIINVTHVRATSCNASFQNYSKFSIAYDKPFAVSPTNNLFTAIGCSVHGKFSTNGTTFNGGNSDCTTPCFACSKPPCSYNEPALYSFCSPPGCCIIALYTVPAKTVEISGQATKPSSSRCGFSAVFDPDTYKAAQNPSFPDGQYGLNLIWGLPLDGYSQSCSTVKGTPAYACSPDADCVNVTNLPGYVCNCSRTGYVGDGYLKGTGCEDIDECKERTDYKCVNNSYKLCSNTDGGYACGCKKGAKGNGRQDGTGCTKDTIPTTIIIAVSVLSTSAAIAIAGFSALWIYKARTSKIRKAKYFAKNGGIRLQEYISTPTGTSSAEAPRLYSEVELKKATGNFSQDLQLGRGGYGTVYKGILSDRTTVVAVKKSNHSIEDHEIVDQFINEIIILSQINHRNIVKLLGCCLETAVPLLVYEYISNGTLFEHLHGKDGRFLSWESRLVVALESAQALAYLHSYASTPIFHRDIKSSNILLDVALTAKVSDFGISRLLPMGDTHVSTVVHGTMGYLDPEYFQTLQLTEKSDVFSSTSLYNGYILM